MKVLGKKQNTVSLVVESDGIDGIILKLNFSWTIDQVLATVCKKWNLAKDKYCLELAGRKLEKYRTLSDANLPNGTILKVKLDDFNDDSTRLQQILVDVHFEDEERTLTDKFNLNGKRPLLMKPSTPSEIFKRLQDSLWDVYTRLTANRRSVWEEIVRFTCQGRAFKTVDQMARTKLAFFGENAQRLYFSCQRTQLPWLNLSSTAKYFETNEGTESDRVLLTKSQSSQNFILNSRAIELSERFGRIYHKKFKGISSPREEPGGKRLKINVPQNYVVEADFKESETVGDVINFVAKYTTCSPDKFYLCLKLPKLYLDPRRKIGEVGSFKQGVTTVCLVPIRGVKKSFSFDDNTLVSLEGDSLRQIVASASSGSFSSLRRSALSEGSKLTSIAR